MDTHTSPISSRGRQTRKANAEEMFTFRDVIDIFLDHWIWFVLSVVLCLFLSRLYLSTRCNVYQRQAVMLVKDDAGSGSRKPNVSTDALLQLNGVLTGTSVKNEVYILHSFQLVREVVAKLHLDVTYDFRKGLRDISLYNDRPVTVDFLSDFTYPLSFHLEILSGREFRLSEVQYGAPRKPIVYEKKGVFGQELQTPFGKLVITPLPENLNQFLGKTITVRRYSIEDASILTQNKVKTGEIDKESTLVRLICVDTNIQRADDILSGLLEAYKQSIITDKNQIARSTSDFIEERIRLIHSELSSVESQLADFKQSNGVVDIKTSSSAFMSQSISARQRTVEVETQYAMVNYLVDYLTSNSEGNALIPTMGGISDVGITGQISQYNQLMLTRNRLAENSGDNSPSLRELDENLSQMRQAVLASLRGYTSSLALQVDRAVREERGLNSTLTAVPKKEKELLDIARQQAIKETLYTYLLNKREETALQLAITEANIRIVEQPFGSKIPISPRKFVISLIALVLGILLPFAFFQIKALLNMKVRGRKDIETYTTIPILGEIPHRKESVDDSMILVAEQSADPICEAFRMLRFSINFINKEARVIMLTSTMPGEGKTFVSRNFAATLGMTGKRVVLVDTDIRKRTQSRLSSLEKSMGLTSYLSGNEEDLDKLIVEVNRDCNLYFLPAGSTPPNPAELLMSDRLDRCISELKKQFDYVVIDNVPAQVVADAGIVNRIADITIYVVRENKIDRRYLPELQRLHQEKRFNNLCIVLNDSHLEKKKYGYGYGYGYGHEKKRKRSFPWR